MPLWLADKWGWISLKNITTPFWKSKTFQEQNSRGEDWFSIWHDSGVLRGFDKVFPGLGTGIHTAYGKIADANWQGTNKDGGQILIFGGLAYLAYRFLK